MGVCRARLAFLQALSEASMEYVREAGEMIEMMAAAPPHECKIKQLRVDSAKHKAVAAKAALRKHDCAHGCQV